MLHAPAAHVSNQDHSAGGMRTDVTAVMATLTSSLPRDTKRLDLLMCARASRYNRSRLQQGRRGQHKHQQGQPCHRGRRGGRTAKTTR